MAKIMSKVLEEWQAYDFFQKWESNMPTYSPHTGSPHLMYSQWPFEVTTVSEREPYGQFVKNS